MDKHIGFRFNTQNGFDHLCCAIASNAVADNSRTVNPLTKGALVAVLAKKNDRYMGALAIAEGAFDDRGPQDIWDEWTVTQTKVHKVKFITRPVFVPSELAARGTNMISAQHAEELADFFLVNG